MDDFADEWLPYMIQQTNGRSARIKLQAHFQIVTEKFKEVFACPYIVYMPEKRRLLMLAAHGYPHKAVIMTSTDYGASWSEPRYMRVDEKGEPTLGMGVGLAYMGAGRVVVSFERTLSAAVSRDYGESWPEDMTFPLPNEHKGPPATVGCWDPMLVERSPKSDEITRLTMTSWRMDNPSNAHGGGAPYSQGFIFWSTDEGLTWSEPLRVPEWQGVSEVALTRARNDDLIAACRTDIPAYFPGESLDHYEGLGVSISRDNGSTWSSVNKLYDWGRHHPCIVVMPDGDVVMTYVVRKGYINAPDGFPQFGIEAVVSSDNGETWDLDHKYILASWKGNRTGQNAWWASSQCTSTVVLPDGTLLTAFGTGYRSQPGPGPDNLPAPRDIGIVRWRLNAKGLNTDREIAGSVPNSDLRNKFDPSPLTIPA